MNTSIEINSFLKTDWLRKSIGAISSFLLFFFSSASLGQNLSDGTMMAKKVEDFSLAFEDSQWKKTNWINLDQIRGQQEGSYATKVKILYSPTGLYIQFQCKDSQITADFTKDFEKLWKQDVVEVFIRPDKEATEYLEYELSPLNHELILLVSNKQGNLSLWMPYMYDEKENKTRHKTVVRKGMDKEDGEIISWSAMVYLPFGLLRPLKNIEPTSGTEWQINFYRIDYDEDIKWWAWRPIEKGFHEYEKFGKLIFE